MPRAHGRIVDGAGVGVVGHLYFYRAIDFEPSAWRAMMSSDERPVTTTIFGRPLVWRASARFASRSFHIHMTAATMPLGPSEIRKSTMRRAEPVTSGSVGVGMTERLSHTPKGAV